MSQNTDVLAKVMAMRDDLATNLLERETAIETAILALLVGEHLVLLGPPGTAKSMMVRAICQRIDGANYFRRLTRITLPMISPFIFFQFVVSFIYSMQQFIQPDIMNPRPIRGENVTMTPPPRETFFVMSRGFYTVITQNRFAYGLAMLWILFFIVLIITILFVKLGGFWVYTETEDRR